MKNFLIILWVVFVFSALTLLVWHEVKSHNTSAGKPAPTQQSMYSAKGYHALQCMLSSAQYSAQKIVFYEPIKPPYSAHAA